VGRPILAAAAFQANATKFLRARMRVLEQNPLDLFFNRSILIL